MMHQCLAKKYKYNDEAVPYYKYKIFAEKHTKILRVTARNKNMWKVEDVKVVPLIISTAGVILKCLHGSINLLEFASTSFILM